MYQIINKSPLVLDSKKFTYQIPLVSYSPQSPHGDSSSSCSLQSARLKTSLITQKAASHIYKNQPLISESEDIVSQKNAAISQPNKDIPSLEELECTMRSIRTSYKEKYALATSESEKEKLDEELRIAMHTAMQLPKSEQVKIRLNYFNIPQPELDHFQVYKEVDLFISKIPEKSLLEENKFFIQDFKQEYTNLKLSGLIYNVVLTYKFYALLEKFIKKLDPEVQNEVQEALTHLKSARDILNPTIQWSQNVKPYGFDELDTAIKNTFAVAFDKLNKKWIGSTAGYWVNAIYAEYTARKVKNLTDSVEKTKIILLYVELLIQALDPQLSELEALKANKYALIKIIEWLEADVPQRLEILKNIEQENKDELEFFQSLVSSQGMAAPYEFFISHHPPNSYTRTSTNIINIFRERKSKEAIHLVHELAHRVEYAAEILKDTKNYHDSRCSHQLITTAIGVFKASCDFKAVKKPYIQRIYIKDGKQFATELPSTGIESLYLRPQDLYDQDPDLFFYLLGVFRFGPRKELSSADTDRFVNELIREQEHKIYVVYTKASHQIAQDTWKIDKEMKEIFQSRNREILVGMLNIPYIRSTVVEVLRLVDLEDNKGAKAYMEKRLLHPNLEYQKALKAIHQVVDRLIQWKSEVRSYWKEGIEKNIESILANLNKKLNSSFLTENTKKNACENASEKLQKAVEESLAHLIRDIGKTARGLIGIVKPNTHTSTLQLILNLSANSSMRKKLPAANPFQAYLSKLRSFSGIIPQTLTQNLPAAFA